MHPAEGWRLTLRGFRSILCTLVTTVPFSRFGLEFLHARSTGQSWIEQSPCLGDELHWARVRDCRASPTVAPEPHSDADRSGWGRQNTPRPADRGFAAGPISGWCLAR